MPGEVERFLKIQRSENGRWRTIPLGERVRVWEASSTSAEDGTKLMLFHVAFMDGLSRGQRVAYLGSDFDLVAVSNSKRLVGLELRCAPIARDP